MPSLSMLEHVAPSALWVLRPSPKRVSLRHRGFSLLRSEMHIIHMNSAAAFADMPFVFKTSALNKLS